VWPHLNLHRRNRRLARLEGASPSDRCDIYFRTSSATGSP
jgi:hypothetical protein